MRLDRLLEDAYRELFTAWSSLKYLVWGDPSDYGYGPALLGPGGSLRWDVLLAEPGVYLPVLLAVTWCAGSFLSLWFPPARDRTLQGMRRWTGVGLALAAWGLFTRLWYHRPASVLLAIAAGFLPLGAVWTDRCPQCRRRWLEIDVSIGDTTVTTRKACPAEDCGYRDTRRSARRREKAPGPYDAISARALGGGSSSRSSSRPSSRSSGGGGGSSSGGGGSSSYGGGTSGGGGAGRSF